jgi:hypothetical protein
MGRFLIALLLILIFTSAGGVGYYNGGYAGLGYVSGGSLILILLLIILYRK